MHVNPHEYIYICLYNSYPTPSDSALQLQVSTQELRLAPIKLARMNTSILISKSITLILDLQVIVASLNTFL
jgi:hypothetical protein